MVETSAWDGVPVRDADWCEKELADGRPITGQRIHLARKLREMPGSITSSHITTEFEGHFMDGDEPVVVAIFDEFGFRLGPGFQH